ncbi:hypothetical protein BUALT_Bualt17G0042500 [Buddleja alternifolia]|uniref:PARP n=1 Tax=Buddleja alternifolia TaxID=168488 RepID=A0AAV6WCD6_9LAMI|nr:hypothetical protein BUALT_Bualt17G0042500 [Buddleja alternifolia]
MEHNGVEDQVSMTIRDYDTTAYDSDCESPESVFRRFDGMVRLEENRGDSSEYCVIQRSFMAGMGVLGRGINVISVHKNSYSSFAGQAKLEMFRIFSQAVAERRGGDANIKYAWYGGARDEVCGIVEYGFGRVRECESHGVGVHLSPANVPIDSALKAEEDENGVRHMLLCRVILGKTEIISADSKQFHPSATDFDSGIDNPLDPRKYIIWTPYMNSHIFPNYIISFTGCMGNRNSTMRPNYPRMKLPVLLNVLSRFLEPSKMSSVQKYYNDFRDNKIQRSQLIIGLRSLVGDKILVSVMKFREALGASRLVALLVTGPADSAGRKALGTSRMVERDSVPAVARGTRCPHWCKVLGASQLVVTGHASCVDRADRAGRFDHSDCEGVRDGPLMMMRYVGSVRRMLTPVILQTNALRL